MPNYSLVVNSQFKPFSYAELTAPLDRQELYHEKLAEEYDNLSKQADVLEIMAGNEQDKNSGSYSRYKSYSDALRAEADSLFKYGLNTESRQRLTDLRRRYNTDIVPIQNAWSKREKEADDQMKASLQNPSLMFTRDARTTTLDDYIKNPTGGYGVINGANITAQMASMAKNLEKQILNGSTRKENIDSYTYDYIRKYGLTADMVRDWRNSPTLSKMFEQVMQANGVTPEALQGSLNAQSIIDKSTGYAEMGMWNAIGEDKASQIENYGARLAAQEAKERRMADYNARLAIEKEASKKNDGGMPTITSDGVGIETSEHYTAKGLAELGSLKAGNDGLKASVFGRTGGQVNPMQIYDEFQQERKKHTKQVSRRQEVNNPYDPTPKYVSVKTTVPDDDAAREAVLKKYRQYGVTDILTENQYNLLKDMGYSRTNNPSTGRARYSTLEQGFNNLVQQKNRFSVNMTKYDSVDEDIRGNLTSYSQYNQLSGRLWPIEENGKEGKPVRDASDLGLYSADNTKGNKVNGIYYDPQFRGKIVFRLSDGKKYTATADVLGNEISNMIKYMEADPRFTPKHIAAALYEALNTKNKVQSETDSKI